MDVRGGRFRPEDRLRSEKDYRRVGRWGRRLSSRNFVVLVVERRDGTGARLGTTVSRRLGGAVTRNRVKRSIREWFRLRKQQLGSLDLVVIARPPAASLGGQRSAEELSRLLGLDEVDGAAGSCASS